MHDLIGVTRPVILRLKLEKVADRLDLDVVRMQKINKISPSSVGNNSSGPGQERLGRTLPFQGSMAVRWAGFTATRPFHWR